MKTKIQNSEQLDGILALRVWTAHKGVSDTTVWRWRSQGWLHPINICGKLYLTQEDRTQFEDRAVRGEFAKAPGGAAKAKPA